MYPSATYLICCNCSYSTTPEISTPTLTLLPRMFSLRRPRVEDMYAKLLKQMEASVKQHEASLAMAEVLIQGILKGNEFSTRF
jgi:hypothetical protein